MSNIRVSKEEYLDYLGVNSINVSRMVDNPYEQFYSKAEEYLRQLES